MANHPSALLQWSCGYWRDHLSIALAFWCSPSFLVVPQLAFQLCRSFLDVSQLFGRAVAIWDSRTFFAKATAFWNSPTFLVWPQLLELLQLFGIAGDFWYGHSFLVQPQLFGLAVAFWYSRSSIYCSVLLSVYYLSISVYTPQYCLCHLILSQYQAFRSYSVSVYSISREAKIN